jgi:hypothetical protein
MKKKVLEPDRIRKINGSFAFIEHRFLRDGFFDRSFRDKPMKLLQPLDL